MIIREVSIIWNSDMNWQSRVLFWINWHLQKRPFSFPVIILYCTQLHLRQVLSHMKSLPASIEFIHAMWLMRFSPNSATIMITTVMTDRFLALFSPRAAFLCGSGWTSLRIPTSPSTSMCLRWWTPRSLSSPRPLWMPVPRANTNSAGWVGTGKEEEGGCEVKEQEGRWQTKKMRTKWITWEVERCEKRNVRGQLI